MNQHTNLLVGTYDPILVGLSVVIAIIASYTALDLAGRVTAARDRTRLLWLLGGAFAMGTGIWSMHFIGMLAFSLPIPVYYYGPTVFISHIAAVAASAVALLVVSRPALTLFSVLGGATLMGTRHYHDAVYGFGRYAPTGDQSDTKPAWSLSVLSNCYGGVLSWQSWIVYRLRKEESGLGTLKRLGGALFTGCSHTFHAGIPQCLLHHLSPNHATPRFIGLSCGISRYWAVPL